MRADVNLALVGPVQLEDFFDLLWQGVWEATFDLASFGVQVRNLTTERNNVSEQREILTQLLEESVDGIAIRPAECCGVNDLIARHQARGTPVVTFHSDAPESGRAAFVGPNAIAAGKLAGEVLTKLPGPRNEYHIAQRYEGFRAALSSQPGLKEATCKIRLDAGNAAQLVEALQHADGLYVGSADVLKLCAILKQAKLGLPCVGFQNTDGVRGYLEDGTLSMAIDESRYQQGYFAVQKAYEAAIGKDRESIAGIQIPSSVVVAANASVVGDSSNNAFELLVRQRTEVLHSYKARLEQANAELLKMAVTDPLTDLLNQRRFEEVLRDEIARALSYGRVSLLMIDINMFKQINNRYGHQVGDNALRVVAGVLQSSCRSTDLCARLGGDEFVMILPDTAATSAVVLRERIARNIAAAPVPTGAGEIILGLSIGIASAPGDATTAEGLLAAADAAMYQVKQLSRSLGQ